MRLKTGSPLRQKIEKFEVRDLIDVQRFCYAFREPLDPCSLIVAQALEHFVARFGQLNSVVASKNLRRRDLAIRFGGAACK